MMILYYASLILGTFTAILVYWDDRKKKRLEKLRILEELKEK